MNVSRPSEAVVPTLDGPVLTTLAKLTDPATGRQIHQLAGVGSEAGVRNVLTRLVHHGIVRANRAGSAVLYVINREHLAWPAVEALTGLRGQLLQRLRDELEGWVPQARTAALFGSAARGDGDADSDIDLLLVRQQNTDGSEEDVETWHAQVSVLRNQVAAWTGNYCQIYDIGSADLERHIAASDPLVAAWRADAITVCGADLRTLLRVLGHRVAT